MRERSIEEGGRDSEENGEEGGREVVRRWMERIKGGGLRGRRERGSEEVNGKE